MKDPHHRRVASHSEEYAASFNHDLKAICEDLRSKQGRDGREVVSFPPKRPKGWVEPTTEQPSS